MTDLYTYKDWTDALISMDGQNPEEFIAQFGIEEEGFEHFVSQAFRDSHSAATFAAGVQVAFNLLHRKGVLINA